MIPQQIKRFLNRNKTVFIIGGMTVFVFAGLIYSASNRNLPSTSLIEADEELIAPHTYAKGKDGSKITLVEFTDFGCYECASLHTTANETFNEYKDYVKYGVRHFPQPKNKRSDDAAVAAQAAGDQGKFWDYVDVLFEFQNKFTKDQLITNADLIGLDTSKFENDISGDEFRGLINQDVELAKRLGISTVPTFFVNGKQVLVNEPDDLKNAVERAMREAGIDPDTVMTEEEIQKEQEKQKITVSLHEALDETRGTLDITYDTEDGFKPWNEIVQAGQLVRWTNNSEETILLEQLMPRYDALKNPIEIKPGETFEFRLTFRESGLWTYQEKNSKTVARLEIKPLPLRIRDALPKEIE